MSSGRPRRTGRGRGGDEKAHFGVLGCGGLFEQLSPQLCPLCDGRTEDLSVCPRAVPVNRTGGWGGSLYSSHLGVPLDVVMGGVSVLNKSRVLCTKGSEQDCWQPALPEPVVLWGAGMVFWGGWVSPALSHPGTGTCRVPPARASSTSRWTRSASLRLSPVWPCQVGGWPPQEVGDRDPWAASTSPVVGEQRWADGMV